MDRDLIRAAVDFARTLARNAAMRQTSLLLCLLFLCGCTSNGQRIDRMARAAELHRVEFEHDGYRTLIYMQQDALPDGRLFVFLEGDGRPWRAGVAPSTDPTTGHPLALGLLMRTQHAAAYLTRPCYHRMSSARCTPDKWTSARYAEEIVLVMTAAAREAARRAAAQEIVLIGHSGGGALAVLMAERLESVAAVITIAANLDIEAWSQHHGYLPLSQSLNPAQSDVDHPWLEIHIAGKLDTVVPSATTTAYFERYPTARHWLLDGHTHACCWLDEWPELWERIEGELE